MSNVLRDYQNNSIELIKYEYKKGFRKVMLVLPTGAGKSVIACKIIKKTVENNKKVIFIVRGISLINQMSKTLFRESVEHGVLQANHWNRRPNCPVQVASIDTLISKKIYPPADFIIIDEVDQATSKGYKEFLSMYSESFVLGVTATPYFTKPITHAAETFVVPITMNELINQKYLVPFKYYAPNSPDLSGVEVSKSTNDYVNDQLAETMIKGRLTGEIIKHWRKLGEDRPTLCFAVNVNHSKILVDRFNAAGIPSAHCDANTPQKDRDEIFLNLKNKKLKIVSNVGIATRGFDAPFVSCLILARPTKSLNLHIQIMGRGTRISPETGKENCIVLDHAGNIESLGLPTDEHEINLDGKNKRDSYVKESKICEECFAVYRGKVCPECGSEKAKTTRKVKLDEDDGELRELTQEDIIKMQHKKLIKEAKKKGQSKWSAHYKLIDRFGIDLAAPFLPPTFVEKYRNRNNNIFSQSWVRGAVRNE